MIEIRDDLRTKLKEVGYVIPKMSEAILILRKEVSEGKRGASTRTKTNEKSSSSI